MTDKKTKFPEELEIINFSLVKNPPNPDCKISVEENKNQGDENANK